MHVHDSSLISLRFQTQLPRLRRHLRPRHPHLRPRHLLLLNRTHPGRMLVAVLEPQIQLS